MKQFIAAGSFGGRLVVAIANKNMTQGDLAKLLGVSAAHISAFVHGRKRPTHTRLYQLCAILDVKPRWLLGSDPKNLAMFTQEILRKYNATPGEWGEFSRLSGWEG